MRPTYQTEFGEFGNCMSACIASILDIPLRDIPNFTLYKDRWFPEMRNWLIARGYEPIYHYQIDRIDWDNFPACISGWENLEFLPYYMHNGKSPRGYGHATVGYKGKMIHDPHPEGGGVAVEDYCFLIKSRHAE